jgi:post-segregation antitoxin (ccd killing protein)
MKSVIHKTSASKKSAAPGINTGATRETRCRQWLQENRPAIDAYKRRIEQHGAFSHGLWRF